MTIAASPDEQHRWRELKLFHLYRIFVGCTFGALLLSPVRSELLTDPNQFVLPLIALYLLLAVAGWLYAHLVPRRLTLQILVAVGLDLALGTFALVAFGGLGGGTGALLLVTVAMASLMLPGRLALLTAALATLAVLGEAPPHPLEIG